MVPEEWPIAVEPADPAVEPARARGPGRLATVRLDFFLDSTDRLSEQERALMTAMLRDLVATVCAMVRANVDGQAADPQPARIVAMLNSASLLDHPNVIRLLLRRADEQRIISAFAGQAGPRRLPLLPALVSDPDPAIAAAAMALVVARGRRRDAFGNPRVDLGDLDHRAAVILVHAVAAALSPSASEDGHYAAAAKQISDSINHDGSLDRAVEALVESLDAAARANEELIEAASSEGEIALVTEIIARRTTIHRSAVWDHLIDTGAGGLALIARMANLSRRAAARLIADLGLASGAGSIEDEIARYDTLQAGEVAEALAYWQLTREYRAARDAIGGQRG